MLKNAQRLGIEYVDENDQKHHPVIIHSAVPGGIERFLYMIFDNFKESMPLWLYPIQIRLIPVNDKAIEFCEKLQKKYENHARIDIDDRSESVSKRIKDSHGELIPYSIVIGEKEIKANRSDELSVAVNKIRKSQKGKPFIKRSWPGLKSIQINV